MTNNVWKFGGRMLHSLEKPFLSPIAITKVQIAGIKFFWPKPPLDTSEWPEQRKLRMMEKQPKYYFKTPKMYKMIKLMRGPEPVHNELLYKGFGVKALLGGRMKIEHFETIRRIMTRHVDTERMFPVWRVDDPWQPLTKKGTGKRLGGGKGAVHHYCTPIRAGRIIVELAGDVHIIEAEKILKSVIAALPFPSRFVSQRDIEAEKKNEEWVRKNNINPYDMEYAILNNMGGCRKFLSKYDLEWLGKYK